MSITEGYTRMITVLFYRGLTAPMGCLLRLPEAHVNDVRPQFTLDVLHQANKLFPCLVDSHVSMLLYIVVLFVVAVVVLALSPLVVVVLAGLLEHPFKAADSR